MNDAYVNSIASQMGFVDVIMVEDSGSKRLYKFHFIDGITTVFDWVIEQVRMDYRESERTLDMDSYLRDERDIEELEYIDNRLLGHARE